MKSKFAKFVDRTVGACLIFFAATAVMRYYTTLQLAMFSALAITACICLLLGAFGKRRYGKYIMSKNAQDMFFDFMFMDERAPARLLCKALNEKNITASLHGNGVYARDTAAFCFFDNPPDQRAIARTIAKSKRYGASKVLLLCKMPPQAVPNLNEVTVKIVSAENVYCLFGSLGALPDKKYSLKQKSRFSAFSHALDKDKIIRYIVLAAALFGVSVLSGGSLIPFICACAAASLAIISIVMSVTKKVKSAPRKSEGAEK